MLACCAYGVAVQGDVFLWFPCTQLNKVKSRSDPFPAAFFKVGSFNPVTWWKGLKYAALPEGLVELMIQLHSACASSASIERIFSSFGLIHNKIRNRLGVEKAAKLVFYYRMLRGKEDLDY